MHNQQLEQNCTYLIVVDLNDFDPIEFIDLLKDEELKKAFGYKTELDRRRSIVGRGILKVILSEITLLPVKDLHIRTGVNGKPELSEKHGVHFCLSHAGDRIAIVVDLEAQVGVDIERIDRSIEFDKLKEFLFHTNELNEFDQLGGEDQKAFFLKYWTQKEALLKATGQGLSGSMKSIELLNKKDDSPTIFFREGSGYYNWTFESFFNEKDYYISVAVNKKGKKIEQKSMNNEMIHKSLNY